MQCKCVHSETAAGANALTKILDDCGHVRIWMPGKNV